MEDLLLKLGQRDSFRRLLALLEKRLGPEAVDRVLDEMEALLVRLNGESGVEEQTGPKGEQKPAPVSIDVTVKDPFADLLATLDLRPVAKVVLPEPPQKPPAPPEPPPQSDQPAEEAAKPLPPPVPAPKPVSPPAPPKPVPPPAAPKPVPPPAAPKPVPPPAAPKPVPPPAAPEPVPPPPRKAEVSKYLPKQVAVRTPYPLDDSDLIYLHAAAQIPLDEKPALEPFILEERGIESRESAFALDRGGLRFYLSRISGRSMNVSKTGMLLLSKQESLQLRGTHHAVLNELRTYGLLLPFQFGTVALGVADLHGLIDGSLYDLRDGVEETVATKWWSVQVFALDQKMAQLVSPEGATGSGRDQDRRTTPRQASTPGRLDIKTLERVLTRQKSIAEEIHQKLNGIAGRSDVDLIIGFSSGSSEEWKPILRASYEVGVPEVYQFNSAVADLQVLHLKYQLMFTITGDREDVVLPRT